MNRTFKQFTITAGGTPQPLVGTFVTATTNPSGQDFQGEATTVVPVSDSSMFLQGDRVLFQSITNTFPELATVQAVPDTTHITIRNLTRQRIGGVFGVGDFVSLAIAVSTSFVQCGPGNTGTIVIGTVGMNKTGLVKVIAQLLPFGAAVQPLNYTDSRYYTADPMMASDLWIDGTTSDAYLPSFGVA